jgi:hypothetical protein
MKFYNNPDKCLASVVVIRANPNLALFSALEGGGRLNNIFPAKERPVFVSVNCVYETIWSGRPIWHKSPRIWGTFAFRTKYFRLCLYALGKLLSPYPIEYQYNEIFLKSDLDTSSELRAHGVAPKIMSFSH